MPSSNIWLRFLVAIIGIIIGWVTVYRSHDKRRDAIGIITILCSVIIPIIISAQFWWTRMHSLYNSDWELLSVWLNLTNVRPETFMLLLYLPLFSLWVACIVLMSSSSKNTV